MAGHEGAILIDSDGNVETEFADTLLNLLDLLSAVLPWISEVYLDFRQWDVGHGKSASLARSLHECLAPWA
jgi:hypothetical protein